MKTMTATEASRTFASVLDQVEQGETVVVTRGGRRVATISPAGAGNGARVRALLVGRRIDEDFARDVLTARESASAEGPAWPDD